MNVMAARTASPVVGVATSIDEAQGIATIVLAFAADPVARWTWPRAHDYLAGMPRLISAFGGAAFARRTAYRTDGCTGVALWLPPGTHPDEDMLGTIVRETVGESIRDNVFAVFERMAQYHPSEPHWYLPLIGVDPAHQGQGHGDTLMTYALRRCDEDQVPAYLESTNPRNVALYLRHGFEALGTIQTGASPPLVPMLRQPR